jgi:hypothetical protein
MTDVDVSKNQIAFDGSCKLVPAGSQFVWLRLLDDKKWMNSYQHSMLEVWRSQDSLEGKTQGSTKSRKGMAIISGDTAAANAAAVNSLGDIVTKKWCCTRSYQVLTRVFLTAEKYAMNSTNLLLSTKEENEFRRSKKERSVLLEQICCKRLEETGSNHLRDWLNRIWVLFVTGIDNDPAGERVLSYDVRKSVHDAQFTNEDAVFLQASLLFFLIPSLKYEMCHSIATADFHAAPLQKPLELTGFEASQRRSTPSQQLFTRVFIDFVGSFLDTLTEAEIVKVSAAFKPAIWDAHQRILRNLKNVQGSRKKSEDYIVSKGDGIHIDHLDKLGRRKRVQKFA